MGVRIPHTIKNRRNQNMQIVTKGVAGTMESSDIIVRIEPAEQRESS